MITLGVIVVLFSSVIAFKIYFDTIGVCYPTPKTSTDNEKMVQSASKISLFDWPSKMHSVARNRSQLREYWTLCLNILGRFKKGALVP